MTCTYVEEVQLKDKAVSNHSLCVFSFPCGRTVAHSAYKIIIVMVLDRLLLLRYLLLLCGGWRLEES